MNLLSLSASHGMVHLALSEKQRVAFPVLDAKPLMISTSFSKWMGELSSYLDPAFFLKSLEHDLGMPASEFYYLDEKLMPRCSANVCMVHTCRFVTTSKREKGIGAYDFHLDRY